MVGQFQTSDPLMKRELRLTYEDYMAYKNRVGLSNVDLAYDRGVVLAYGVEQTGTDIVGTITNGNGKPHSVERRLDQDNYKNFGFRVNQGISDFMTIGGYYYLGKEASPDSNGINKVTYYGPDLTVALENFELTAQYLYRTDTNPQFDDLTKDIKTDGYVVEMVYSPDMNNSKYYITGLYNLINTDNGEMYKYETATLSYTYLFARNLRLLAEYTRDLVTDNNRFILGIIGAF